jgi:hypothetical protein
VIEDALRMPDAVTKHAAFPLWLKWFLGLGAFVVAGALAGPLLGEDVWFTAVGWALFVWCVLFPGTHPHWPRLFVLAAILWLIAIPLGVLVLAVTVAEEGAAGLFAASLYDGVPNVVLLLPMALYAGLLWSLWRRRPVFRVLVVVDAWTSIVLALIEDAHRRAAGTIPTARIAWDVALSVAVAAYLLWRFRPAVAEDKAESAGPTDVVP